MWWMFLGLASALAGSLETVLDDDELDGRTVLILVAPVERADLPRHLEPFAVVEVPAWPEPGEVDRVLGELLADCAVTIHRPGADTWRIARRGSCASPAVWQAEAPEEHLPAQPSMSSWIFDPVSQGWQRDDLLYHRGLRLRRVGMISLALTGSAATVLGLNYQGDEDMRLAYPLALLGAAGLFEVGVGQAGMLAGGHMAYRDGRHLGTLIAAAGWGFLAMGGVASVGGEGDFLLELGALGAVSGPVIQALTFRIQDVEAHRGAEKLSVSAAPLPQGGGTAQLSLAW